MRWSLHEATSGAEALESLHSQPGSEVLLLDPALPDLLPAEFCGIVEQSFPQLKILMMDTATCHVLPNSAGSPFASRLAAALDPEHKTQEVEAAAKPVEYLRYAKDSPRLRGVVGESPAMMQVYAMTHMVASRETTVLITGESGTGKDLIAQAIHQISPRRQAPFIVVNCAAIPEALLESELFGYAKGAFTGAMQSRIGRIHAAQGGTLFLDEIGDMPLTLQSKILRFVEQGEVQRLGSNDNMRVDVRVVAATNADLQGLVKQKLFREDLYYRLAIFPIKLAPLRDRDHDVPKLAQFFVEKFCPGVTLTDEAIDALCRHKWPGNVRELRNVIERASIMAGPAHELRAKDIFL
ncbi:transcriptional regulator with GAF, ATPase, and Fis domain [Granulicella aggregans]|uniref:Transcriptional regulator with GAF, ATPase, and Fis domain n=2 Tax=Granulicella aggregans TaxID=474949 RepID=A0A7W7ZAN4_9BACT|nr:transcriptional regulator with GAF, ATPase, and Fis domain [Granulicella aggregans]